MPKVVHCSDIHLDSAFAALPAERSEQRRLECLQTFDKIIAHAANADLLLIAGDLFESNAVKRATVQHIIRKFAEIPQTQIFIAPGNHDPYTPESPYARYAWGENVHIFGSDLTCVDLPHCNTCVYGAGFTAVTQRTSGLEKLRCNRECINILLLHGELTSAGTGSTFRPITMEELRHSGVNYAALGHIHSFQGLCQAGESAYAYCGMPEGRGFDETGEKGILVGTVETNAVDLKFVSLCKRQYHCLEVDISDAKDTLDIAEILMRQGGNTGKPDDLYRFVLRGYVQPQLEILMPRLKELLSEHFYYVELEDETQLSFELEELSDENSLRGRFASELLKQRANGVEKETLMLALKYGLLSMAEGGDISI